ncbi:hypothetical protein Bbelb_185850 [Branchiostoma belcheri]|nr:hypothetical protein Bbelb_185850 [Branchiostoma belcheri]
MNATQGGTPSWVAAFRTLREKVSLCPTQRQTHLTILRAAITKIRRLQNTMNPHPASTVHKMYGRRWNLIFHGIQETERENCTRKVMDFISEEMNINTQEMKMCAVHRLGKPRNGKTRPVIARFTCRADRDRVWKNKAHIKNKRIYITDDVPAKVRELRRNILVPALRRVKEGGKRGMIVGNKLVIESKQYEHWEIPRRWLQDETTDGTASDPVREGGGQEEEPTEGRRRPTETVRTQPGQELTNSPRQTRSTLLQIPTYLQAAKRNLRPRRGRKR